MRVLIIPDKFKGTLSASDAAEAMARGWHKGRPEDKLAILPLSDGGDGFGQIIAQLLGAKARRIRTVDAAHRSRPAKWWWEQTGKKAVIESAEIIGLALLPAGEFHPFELDTFGLGKAIHAALDAGARSCWLGIGGSATNDGGFGLARALGWKFFTKTGAIIERWMDLNKLERVQRPARRNWFHELIVAVDVQNPLLGLRGATRVYGPQKGLRPEQFKQAEQCLGRLASCMKRELGRDFAKLPGAGAAGGLGFGLAAFAGATFEAGFDLFVREAELRKRIRTADLVLTGEGSIDRSTMMGKGVGQLARMCLRLRKQCIGLAGVLGVAKTASRKNGFAQLHALTELTSPQHAKQKAAFWLERLAEKSARVTSPRYQALEV